MSAKTRLRTLEKASCNDKRPLLIVWCGDSETNDEAWHKAYGDTPQPKDEQVVFIQWYSGSEPPARVQKEGV
jgi:hypothetical protein